MKYTKTPILLAGSLFGLCLPSAPHVLNLYACGARAAQKPKIATAQRIVAFVFSYLALALLVPAAASAQSFGKVVNARDAVYGAAQIPVSSTSSFAPITDPRDTMPMAPPPAVAAAPIQDREVVTAPLEPIKPVSTAAPSPTLPPLVKRALPQKVTEAAPGILLVQPANVPEIPMNTNGTLNGQMFHDRTETLTPNGIVDDQPEPKNGFSFGGNEPPSDGPVITAPTEPSVTQPTISAPIISATAAVASPSIMAVRVLSPSTVIAASPSTVVSATKPLTAPIATGLTFTADDLALSAKAKQALDSFTRIAHGNVLSGLTISQRTVAPLNALDEVASARRKAILDYLRQAGVIGSQTRVSEVRVKATTPQSHVTLIGTP